jgi:phage terminase small subunit
VEFARLASKTGGMWHNTDMSTLTNIRHEIFANELAKGKTADEAYQLAGYAKNDGNCIRLKGDERIKPRVAELLEQGAEHTLITIETLTQMFLQDRELARKLGQAGAAKGATDSLAKLHGFYIERSERGAPGDFDRMSEAQLEEIICRGLGLKTTSRQDEPLN